MVNATGTALTGWGRTGWSRAEVSGPLPVDRLQELVAACAAHPGRGVLARGAGRSYGDAATNAGGHVLNPVTRPCVDVDVAAGTVHASASVTFAELLRATVPHGLLPPVLPGTRHLTVGGAVAADVHGKNQHGDGTVSAWLDEIEVLDGNGKLHTLTPRGQSAAFRATVGGMGLTGVILAVRLRLLRVRSALLRVTTRRLPDLDALLAALADADGRYAVAWIDTSAAARSLGRGVLDVGDHLDQPDPRAEHDGLGYRLRVPPKAVSLPFCPVSPVTARAFNGLWYGRAPAERSTVMDMPGYFHRLDAVDGWNRVLGPRGFIQYQFAVPQHADHVIVEVLEALRRHRAAPFLGTLKRFGPASGNYLSFPIPGWSLAVDMPAGRPGLRRVLDELDRRVVDAGGRVYLAKDSRLGRAAFTAMYPDVDRWYDARRQLDPHGVFRSDLGRRLGLC